jgi:hypothetical protein
MTPLTDPIFRSLAIQKCLLAPSLRVGHEANIVATRVWKERQRPDRKERVDA